MTHAHHCQVMQVAVVDDGPPGRLMIDATHPKAHRTTASLLQKGGAATSAGPEAG